MKKTLYYLCLVASLVSLASCSDNDELADGMQTNFTSFKIKGYEDAVTTIDVATRTVTVRLPDEVTSGKDLVPVFTVSEGTQASINRVIQQSGTNAMDFSNEVLYTVANADYTAKYGMGNFLTDRWSNNGTNPDGYYIQQQHTGEYSSVNCGPTCAVMALKWRDPNCSVTVEDARNTAVFSEIDGSTWWYPRDIYNCLKRNGVNNVYYWNFTGASYDGYVRSICNLLEQGNLCISCLNNGNISEQTALNKEYHTNRYYKGGAGHYLLIKGYRVVNGVTWLEVHDPWGNDLKYSDGSYYGANRYYKGSEVATSIDWNIWTVVVPYE